VPELVRTHDQLWNELKSSLKNEPVSRRVPHEDDALEALDTMPPPDPQKA
jgi:hypothetical protein